jgi:SdrD B-like domain
MNTLKPSFTNQNFNKTLLSLFGVVSVLSLVFIYLVGMLAFQNTPAKTTQAAGVYVCPAAETLSGTNCTSTPASNPVYTEACPTGYTPMDYTCVTFVQKACNDYTGAVADTVDTTMCKLSDPDNIFLAEIRDSDGRQCKGTGFNFKQYAVGTPISNPSGPVVCANIFSQVAQKANFRFIPRTINSIKDFITTQTGTNQTCPTGYTLASNLCTIPASVSNCSSAGEYLDIVSGSCKPCPVNKYCVNSTAGEIATMFCPNGGTIIDNLCVAANKVSVTSYTDGCTAGYVKYDQTCAIEEVRTHDIDLCSYYYAATNTNTLAQPATPITNPLLCSTGGSTDFASTDIVKVSDLQCNGVGTAWYSYNVAYDPLVCGNTYDPNNKAAFRWTAKSFIKIVGLQKLPITNTQCPASWTTVPNSQNCSQNPVLRKVAIVNDCPNNTPNSPQGSIQLSNCTGATTNTPVTTVLGTISGYVYIDNNNNGIVDANESGIAGVKIDLIPEGACSTGTKSATTDNGGKYQFLDLAPCTYTLSEIQPANYSDGIETVGKINNATIGITTQNDKITGILINANNSVYNNFGELSICKLGPNEYLENNQCKICPKGTSIKIADPKNINDCKQNITIVIPDMPTIRTGGLNLFEIIIIVFSIFVMLIASYVIKINRQEFLKNWFKVK